MGFLQVSALDDGVYLSVQVDLVFQLNLLGKLRLVRVGLYIRVLTDAQDVSATIVDNSRQGLLSHTGIIHQPGGGCYQRPVTGVTIRPTATKR